METTRQNLLYIANEYLYLTCAFFILGFSAYTHSAATRYQIGWFYIAFLGVILSFNMLVMLVDIITGIKQTCMQRYRKKVETARLQRLKALRAQTQIESSTIAELEKSSENFARKRRAKITVCDKKDSADIS